MDWAEHPILRYFVLISLVVVPILLLANIVVLDVFMVQTINTPAKNITTTTVTSVPSPTSSIEITPTLTPTATAQIPIKTAQASAVKEYFIPLGTGSFYSEGDWGDVTSAQVSLDNGNFGKIKNVTFEAAVKVSDANEDVSLRLFDVTDQHPIWNSELFFPSGSSTFLVSAPITLDAGMKLYRVQIKTQFRNYASVDQSRIHITVQ